MSESKTDKELEIDEGIKQKNYSPIFSRFAFSQLIKPTFRRPLSKVDNIGDKLAQGSEESIFVHH
jgi:hypothetical protein